MRNARARFVAMVDGLRDNPKVDVASVNVPRPASQQDIAAAARLAGGALPDGVAEFYAEMNGFKLDWRHTVAEVSQGDQSDHGLVNILPIGEVFGDWRGVTWFSDDDEFRPVKPFDMFTPEACAAFIKPDGRPPAGTVAYHYFGEELHDTGYSFDEYLDRLLASRGFWYWVQALCRDLQASAEVTAFRRVMPLIFDDYDNQLFQPR